MSMAEEVRTDLICNGNGENMGFFRAMRRVARGLEESFVFGDSGGWRGMARDVGASRSTVINGFLNWKLFLNDSRHPHSYFMFSIGKKIPATLQTRSAFPRR